MGIKGRPPLLVAGAAALAVEALALTAYTVYNVIDLMTASSRTASNAAALIGIQVIVIAALVLLARGALGLRPWTRTPAVMVQVLVGVVGYVLLRAHQYPWGALALALALAGLAGFLAPASLKALARNLDPAPGDAEKPAKPAGKSGKPAGR
ncbi:MAG: hypothetical protein FWE35_03030 [Streptosporangiales bacterium]|jgi:hypothetical protein|nr:hypothetical protein [Streptosporangiales bacterium]